MKKEPNPKERAIDGCCANEGKIGGYCNHSCHTTSVGGTFADKQQEPLKNKHLEEVGLLTPPTESSVNGGTCNVCGEKDIQIVGVPTKKMHRHSESSEVEKIKGEIFLKIVGVPLHTKPIGGRTIALEQGLHDLVEQFDTIWDFMEPVLRSYGDKRYKEGHGDSAAHYIPEVDKAYEAGRLAGLEEVEKYIQASSKLNGLWIREANPELLRGMGNVDWLISHGDILAHLTTLKNNHE